MSHRDRCQQVLLLCGSSPHPQPPALSLSLPLGAPGLRSSSSLSPAPSTPHLALPLHPLKAAPHPPLIFLNVSKPDNVTFCPEMFLLPLPAEKSCYLALEVLHDLALPSFQAFAHHLLCLPLPSQGVLPQLQIKGRGHKKSLQINKFGRSCILCAVPEINPIFPVFV